MSETEGLERRRPKRRYANVTSTFSQPENMPDNPNAPLLPGGIDDWQSPRWPSNDDWKSPKFNDRVNRDKAGRFSHQWQSPRWKQKPSKDEDIDFGMPGVDEATDKSTFQETQHKRDEGSGWKSPSSDADPTPHWHGDPVPRLDQTLAPSSGPPAAIRRKALDMARAILAHDAQGDDPLKKGWVGRSGESGEFTSKGKGTAKKAETTKSSARTAKKMFTGEDAAWKSPPWEAQDMAMDSSLRARALDVARLVTSRSPIRRAMAFDRALVSGALRSQTVRIALDAATSMRTFSPDGHMHVALSNISRASVNPYWGKEIPDAEKLGLRPDQKYMLLRHPDELAKAAQTFNGLPILIDHKPVSAEDHPQQLVVGSTGTDARYEHPFLKNSLHIWSKPAIDAIQSGERKELSCAYHYQPTMVQGVYEGKAFDGVMRDLHGNHLALVEAGRVGPAAVVADSAFDEFYDTDWRRLLWGK